MSRLRVVHVGVGLWGRSWAELIARAPGFRLVGVADAGAPGRAWAEEELRVPAYRGLERALRATEAEAVVLASPPRTHRPLAEIALASGCHVIVEKPFAHALADAVAVAAAAAKAGRLVMVAQNYRFRRQSRALRELVATGALGSLLGVRVSCRRDLRQKWISPRDWRGRMHHPYLLDMAIHHVDLLRMITGTEIVEVDARSWGAPDGPFRHHATVEALLTLDGGLSVSYEGTWVEPLAETSWNGDWELVGSRGRATWSEGIDDALRGTVRFARYGATPRRVALPRLPAVDRLGVLAELRRAIRDGDEPECSAADNLRSLGAIAALARSTEERRSVLVAEVVGG